MARKKNRKELDEESLKKIYTGKNFVPPTDKELETIKEHECESSTDENQVYWHVFGSSCLMTYFNEIRTSIVASLIFIIIYNFQDSIRISPASRVGTQFGTRLSRRQSGLNGTINAVTTNLVQSRSEVRKLDSIPFWQESKAKEKKRRAMVTKQMKGRKKYKWKGLTEEQEIQMESLLDNLKDSPAKDITFSPKNPRLAILGDISSQSELVNIAVSSTNIVQTSYGSNDKPNVDQVQTNGGAGFLNTSSVAEKNDEFSVDNLNFSPDIVNKSLLDSVCFGDDAEPNKDNRVIGTKRKSCKAKIKRRSNAFNPIINNQNDNHHTIIEASMDGVNEKMSPGSSINIDSSIIEIKTESHNNIHTLSNISLNIADTTNYFCGESTPNSEQTGISFLDDSDILRQVREADSFFGGFEKNICNEKASPILDGLTLQKVSQNSIKVRSVRRSSRLFRNQQTFEGKIASNKNENTIDEVTGSMFIECMGNDKRRGIKSLRV